ncbi:glycine betaine/proline transport system substrate-binding protein [Methanococcus maripaludis]|uniref:Glycine betaine/proline transport system substrate-binding protein n=1 Tax=Methanococcus maripaludis TaxID=39152 RepID=A0A7J9NNY6_METMI|nr:glycine betaine ABC transporter substrate-binding protein [Methanococcus maripaludis]MBA2846749.1 glycine betaine/proline transport system substrate-binding protein [Methanococcus maripaludis]MBA2858172.1 glycine betaine/proline transport system substrate-binding protein [Methanococcus maripaludis]MBB6066607.1 glycine betaine/proline transport system substrate-binding protein [Methanococcus maripaludis]
MKYGTLFAIAILGLAVMFSGCVQSPQSTDDTEKGTIKFGLPPWPGVTVKSNVVKVILEEQGYNVELNQLDAGITYAKLADGDLDVSLAGWLPTTHEEYWTQYGNQLEMVHVNVGKTALGLAVPTYTYEAGIQSITDLNGNEELFDGKIIGIEPGAGIMSNTEKAIDSYSLSGYELQSSSTPAMMAELARAINEDENIVVTVWEPHSVFFKFDIKMLDDPEKVYGDGDKVYTIARTDFKDDYPEVYEFFQKFEVDPSVQSEWIYKYSDEGMDPEEVAEEWVANNPELVANWTSHMN